MRQGKQPLGKGLSICWYEKLVWQSSSLTCNRGCCKSGSCVLLCAYGSLLALAQSRGCSLMFFDPSRWVFSVWVFNWEGQSRRHGWHSEAIETSSLCHSLAKWLKSIRLLQEMFVAKSWLMPFANMWHTFKCHAAVGLWGFSSQPILRILKSENSTFRVLQIYIYILYIY